jgi:hypothetical protein
MCRPSVLACRQSGDHSENNLAKFGYILEVKVGKKRERNPSIFLAIIKFWQLGGKTKFSKTWQICELFSNEKSFV